MENVMFFFANLPVYSYGFMLGLGFLLGSCLAQREGKRKGIGSDFVFRYIVRAALVFVLAGRLSFVWQFHGWRTLIYPWALFSGVQLDEVWGLIGAGLYTAYFLLRHVNRPAGFLDAIIPSVALMQSLGHLGSSMLGRETTSVWGVDLGEFVLQPLPLYSALAYYVIFSLLWRLRRNLRYDGQLFLGYLALAALAQRLLLPYREVWVNQRIHGCTPLPLWSRRGLALSSHSVPFTDARRRLSLRDWRSWLIYLASVVGVGLIMIRFFYWRFS